MCNEHIYTPFSAIDKLNKHKLSQPSRLQLHPDLLPVGECFFYFSALLMFSFFPYLD